MTGEGVTAQAAQGEVLPIDDIEAAQVEATQIQEGYLEAEELGIGDRASEMIMAHGRRYMLAEALAKCKEFGEGIRETVDMLRELEVPEEDISRRLNKKIDKKAAEAAELQLPSSQQEAPEPAAVDEKRVKKN